MVEVVQDLLHDLTYAGGVGRRTQAVRSLATGSSGPGNFDYSLVGEDPDNPDGPRIVRTKDLQFSEVLDKPFEEKTYRLQLEEFAFRGGRIVKQVDQKIGDVERMLVHDPLRRSRRLPEMLKCTNDRLKYAHELVCKELDESWRLRFAPFFYPSELQDDASSDAEVGNCPGAVGASSGGVSTEGFPAVRTACPGGWLDLDDMFLTARLLTRYLGDMIDLVGLAADRLPNEALLRPRGAAASPALAALVEGFAARAPWIGARLLDAATDAAEAQKELHKKIRAGVDKAVVVARLAEPSAPAPSTVAAEHPRSRSSHLPTATSSTPQSLHPISPREWATPSPESATSDEQPQLATRVISFANRDSQLLMPVMRSATFLVQALEEIDQVLTVELNNLVSDLHRQMYQAFTRTCMTYVRWKRHFATERERCRVRASLMKAGDAKQRQSSVSARDLMQPKPKMQRRNSMGAALIASNTSKLRSSTRGSVTFGGSSKSDKRSSFTRSQTVAVDGSESKSEKREGRAERKTLRHATTRQTLIGSLATAVQDGEVEGRRTSAEPDARRVAMDPKEAEKITALADGAREEAQNRRSSGEASSSSAPSRQKFSSKSRSVKFGEMD